MFIRNRLLAGASIMRAPEDDSGAEGDKAVEGQAEDKAAAIDPATFTALQTAHERLKKDSAADRAAKRELQAKIDAYEAEQAKLAEEAARKAGDFDTVKKGLEERYGKQLAERDEKISKYRVQLERVVVDAGLAQALAANNVAPEFMPAVTAFLRAGVEIEDDADGNPVAFKSGVPLAEFVKLWAEGEGKHFVRLSNTGGGAQGGKGGGGSKTMTQAEFDALDAKTRAARMAEGWTLKD